jgi:NADH dehydrogenase FAD-containing subunit
MAGKRVVVVGGGVGGAHASVFLQKECDVTLVDPKEYFEILWAELRSMVEPSFACRSVIHHKDYLTDGRLITSNATNITETEVHTADGTRIPYDYCVIATGHTYDLPVNRNERLKLFEEDNKKIEAADSILIVGGGSTGVELAAEIAVDYPTKHVTLVHKGSRLMEFVRPSASRKALDWLKSKKVDVKFNQTVNLELAENGKYVTSSGESITADTHFLCIGKPWGSGWLKETILKSKLDHRGSLMVDANMRVKGHKNIFAIGDITDVPEMKQGYLCERHAGVVAKNIKLLMSGGDESKLAVYKPGADIALVSLGRKDGVAQIPFLTIAGCIPGYIKSGDMFVGKTRKQIGLKP